MTRRSLELTRTLRDGQRQGSLLAAMDRTVTTMGARLLARLACSRRWPNAAPVEARLDAVGEFAAETALRARFAAIV